MNSPARRAYRLLTGNEYREPVKLPNEPTIEWGLIGLGIVLVALVLLIGLVFSSCAQASTLQASYYSNDSLHKEGTWAKSAGRMANGRVFDENALTCATRLYPLGTHLIITNLANNKSVVVVVTDRIGKRFAKTRIDLSKGAFLRIASLKTGKVPIKVDKIVVSVKTARDRAGL